MSKLSQMRPDMAAKSNDSTIHDAIEMAKELTPTEDTGTGIREKHSSGPIIQPRMKMTAQENINYANGGAVKYIKNRVIELNEAMAGVQEEDESVPEWEALTMVIGELERVLMNIPGYTEHSRVMDEGGGESTDFSEPISEEDAVEWKRFAHGDE